MVACLTGVLLGAFSMFVLLTTLSAASGTTDPDGDGSTSEGTVFQCGTANNFDCVNDSVREPTTPSETDDHVTFNRDEFDVYQFDNTITNVDTATTVVVHLYHIEGNTNMVTEVELWDAAETTQIGNSVNLTNRTTAQWDTATFSGLTLTQADLDGLRVRTTCVRPGGGQSSTCRSFALYAEVGYTETVNVSVSATGTQQDAAVGSDNNYLGGVFAITENTGSRDITSITLTETGTVDAANDLNDIRLYHELDTSSPYDCASETYDGTETQYGATSTSFSGANGTSTFSGNASITTTAALCLYVVLDVDADAAPGETIEVEIADPPADVGGTGSPIISPESAVTLPGTTILLAPDLTQIHYHWRDDSGDETSAASLTGGTDDTPFSTAAASTTYRLRLAVSNEGNQTSASTQYRLEYAQKVSTCAEATGWSDTGAAGGDWDMAGTGSGLVEGNDTTDIAEGIGGVANENTSFIGTAGQKETSSETAGIALTASEFYEIEYALRATSSVAEGTSYCFRVTNAGAPIGSYEVYPEATIAADITVSAEGSQIATSSIPSTGVHIGNFVMTDATAGAHEVQSIELTASGTVDAQNDLSNIKLQYDLDMTAPYDCASETYDAGDLQYGATDTDGFGPAGTSTFSGSVTASTTQSVCLYAVLDVGAATTDGATLDIQIDDPSTDVTLDAGTVAPSTLLGIPGVTSFVTIDVAQTHYHWRNNDGDEGGPPGGATSATAGAEDTPLQEMRKGLPYRLRFGIANTGGESSGARQYRLEYAQKVSTCSAATGWSDVGAVGGDFDMVNVSGLTDGFNTTNIAVADGGVTDVGSTFVTSNGGQKDVSSETDPITLDTDEFVDLEYAVEASSTAPSGATFCFRVTDAGTPIETYSTYPEATVRLDTDYFIQRGTVEIPDGQTSVTISAGADYEAPASSENAFIRITNTHMTGSGPAAGTTGNHNAADVTAHVSNPGNIASGITFARAGTSDDTMIAWEIIEYTGAAGGENEMVVREQSTITFGTSALGATTSAIASIADDTDVAVFITGQGNPDTGRFDYNTGLATAHWNAAADTASFNRGEAGADAAVVSYAVVEFVGTNWVVQRTPDHTYTNAGTTETETITTVNSLSRTFIHAQHRAGANLDQHSDLGHEAWLSGSNQVSFRINGNAQSPGSHVSAAWVIENTQSTGDRMEVTRSNGTIGSGGGGLSTTSIAIGKTLDDLTVSSVFTANHNSDTGRSFPESMIRVRLISDTNYEFSISDDLGDNVYRTEVVEWPTAEPTLTQNYYRFYVNNNALDPTDPWPEGGTDLGENTEVTGTDDPIAAGGTMRIRMSIAVTGASMPPGVNAFRLQYGARDSTCTGVSEWHNLGGTGSTTALWRGTSTPVADGTALSGDPPTAGDLNLSVSDVAGTFEEENDTALTPYEVRPGEDVEFDWVIAHNGAPDKTDFCFRMLRSDGAPLDGYDFYPVMRTAGYGAESSTWQWYDDAENETPTTPLAATNTAPIDVAYDNMIQLRLLLKEVNGADGVDVKYRLEFSEESDFSTSTRVAEIGACAEGESLFCYADGGGVDNATITTALLPDADACSAGSGPGCGTHNESGTSSSTSTHIHEAGDASEFAFTIRHAGARVNRTYYFRVYDEQNGELVPLGAGESYPSFSTEGASLTFSMGGTASGTATEGVTTDVGTTPASVGFGTVPFNTEQEAAQQLTLSTNASEGYQVLMYSTGALMNASGAVIDPVSTTNDSPAAWSSACSADADGCFGYHAGDDTLADGSARFSADNTYAAFSSTAEEVAFSSVPVENETTDFIYKLEVRELQDPGDYENGVVFIAVPTF